MPVDLVIPERNVRRMLNDAPDIYNAQFNDGLRRMGGAFMRGFARERLRKGIVHIRRQARTRVTKKGQVALPKSAKLAGFAASVNIKQALEGKALVMGTGNPIMHGFEFGFTVTTRSLVVRTPAAAKLVQGPARRRGKRGGRSQRRTPFRIRLPKGTRIVIEPRLGFRESWTRFRPEAEKRLEKILEQSARAAVRLAGRLRRR